MPTKKPTEKTEQIDIDDGRPTQRMGAEQGTEREEDDDGDILVGTAHPPVDAESGKGDESLEQGPEPRVHDEDDDRSEEVRDHRADGSE